MKESNKEENIYRNLYSFIPSLQKPLYEKDEKNLKDVVDTFVARLKRYNKNGKYDQKIAEILYEFEEWREDPVLYNRKHNIAGTFDKENEEAFAMVNNRSIKSREHDETINEKQKNKKIKKAKFDRKRLKKIGKIVLAVIGAGVIGIGAKQATKNLETIEVPVPDDNSISDINETYDTSWYNLPANEWFSDKDEVYKDDAINLIVSKDKAEKIKNTLNKASSTNNKNEKYSFNYIVEPNDTVEIVEEKTGCNLNMDKSRKLTVGEVITINTDNRETFDKGMSEYKEMLNKIEKMKDMIEPVPNSGIYYFEYIVKHGDTKDSLEDRFKCNLKVGNMLQEGETITINTSNEYMAAIMQKEYDTIKNSEMPISYEYYTIQKGDTLPEIANNYGVSCDDIMKYNSSIKSINKIYEDQTIKIPVYENEKTNGMTR